MIRAVLDELVLFLIPFAVFAVVLALRRRHLLRFEHWSPHAAWLAIAGLVIVFVSLIGPAIFTHRPESGFEPTHMENGQVVPGRFR